MASRGRPFPKGKSGNPGGRLKSNKEVVDLARASAEFALNRLVEIAKGSSPHAVAAARAILDRGYGKPTQFVVVSESDHTPVEVDTTLERLRTNSESGIARRSVVSSSRMRHLSVSP